MRSKTYSKQNLAVAAAIAVVSLNGIPAEATYNDLLRTLEQNNTITAEQAQELRGKAPKYTVRPATSGVVRDLQIRGRVQTQFGYVDAKNDEGSDDYSTFEVRRARIGLRGTMFDSVRAQLEANLVPGSSLSMRSAFLQWREHKPAYIKVGYDKPHSSLEENTSSAEILTVERSVINGLVAAPGPMTGLALDGNVEMLTYGLGVYTDQANRNPSNEDSKYLFNAMVGLTLDDLIGGGNKLSLQAIYLNSDDPDGSVGSSFDDVMTFAAHTVVGGFDLRAEYFLGDNDGEEIKGFYIMPSMYITDNVQAVLRFEQAESDKARGIRAPSRYTRNVPSLNVREPEDGPKFDPQRGDDYQSIYLGLNYYMAGNGHKLMLGLELAELKNTDAGKLESTTVSTAWRMLF